MRSPVVRQAVAGLYRWRLFLLGALVGAVLATPLVLAAARWRWPLHALEPSARVAPPPPTDDDLALLDGGGWRDRNDSLVIVQWTKYFGQPSATYRIGDGAPGAVPCAARCLVTGRRSLLPYAKGVLFHARDVDFATLPPRDINGAQPWIFFSQEPPTMDDWPLRTPEYLRLFDYAMTYRRDSDFPVPYVGADLDDVVRHPIRVPLAEKERAAPIAWVQSNCRSFSHREEYMRELMALVPVHSFGRCLRNQPWPRAPTASGGTRPLTNAEVFARYRFAIVAENSACDDYVTEKLLNALDATVVPIVAGPRAQYAAYLPAPDVAIYMDEHSPAELAALVRRLADDDDAYLWMLRYRRGALPTDGPLEPFGAEFNATLAGLRAREGKCEMCKRLHEDWANERAAAALGRGRLAPAAVADGRAYSPIRGHAVLPDRTCIDSYVDPERLRGRIDPPGVLEAAVAFLRDALDTVDPAVKARVLLLVPLLLATVGAIVLAVLLRRRASRVGWRTPPKQPPL